MLYINGKWLEGKGKNFRSCNPSSNTNIWEGKYASSNQVNNAVNSAYIAYHKWRNIDFESRLEIIEKFYSLVELNKDTIKDLIKLETGKETKDSIAEVGASLAKYKNSLNAFHLRTGKSSSPLGKNIQITNHRPHGILNVIGPFNFPFHLPNGHITPALIAGNVVIFKPSEHTPAVAELMVQLWHDAGLPKGVINLLHGSKEVVQKLAKHPKTNGIRTFGFPTTYQ